MPIPLVALLFFLPWVEVAPIADNTHSSLAACNLFLLFLVLLQVPFAYTLLPCQPGILVYSLLLSNSFMIHLFSKVAEWGTSLFWAIPLLVT